MRSTCFVLALCALVGLAAPTVVAEDDAVADNVRVWNGYLWKDRAGNIQIGWPVVAMGVTAQPDHIIDCPDKAKVEPLVSDVADSYVFWNYTLEKPIEEALPKLPSVLVRFRGPVHVERVGETSWHDPMRMKPAKLLSVEFVDPQWLEHWALVFREPFSPWRIREKPPGDEAKAIKALAPKVADALKKMQAVVGPSPKQWETVKAIDPDASVEVRFRRSTEQGILRWLTKVNADHQIGLDLSGLGELAPSGVELQRWFLTSETKAAFLERVRAAWKGELALLTLPYYVKSRNSTSWTEGAVDEVEAWDEATYTLHRKTTKEIVGG